VSRGGGNCQACSLLLTLQWITLKAQTVDCSLQLASGAYQSRDGHLREILLRQAALSSTSTVRGQQATWPLFNNHLAGRSSRAGGGRSSRRSGRFHASPRSPPAAAAAAGAAPRRLGGT